MLLNVLAARVCVCGCVGVLCVWLYMCVCLCVCVLLLPFALLGSSSFMSVHSSAENLDCCRLLHVYVCVCVRVSLSVSVCVCVYEYCCQCQICISASLPRPACIFVAARFDTQRFVSLLDVLVFHLSTRRQLLLGVS